jgi:hypothetical protein
MKSIPYLLLILAAMLILNSAIAPNTAQAEIYVNNADNASCSNTDDPPCYTSIQSAINAAELTGDTVLVEPGTYYENLDLKGVSIKGRETGRTVISGGGSGTLVTANTGSSPTISNLTFVNASIGIDASNGAQLTITNNIFRGLTTGVKIQAASLTTIKNNVFYDNGTALSTDVDRTITYNIFLSNTTSIDLTSSTPDNNDFYDVAWSGGGNSNISSDPKFVDISSNDFHLKSGSVCIDNIMGAYFGSNPDSIPFQISGVSASLDTTTDIISLNWNQNESYDVTGYRIYYGTSSGSYSGTGATEGSSPISISDPATTSATLSGLTTTVTTPESPTLDPPGFADQQLILSWNAVDGATEYQVYYGTSYPPDTTINVGDTTTYTLSGLTNGQTYYVGVSAIAVPAYYIAVTAINGDGSYNPGVTNESAYSDEAVVSFGDAMESALSNVESEFPEALIPYPNLPNTGSGCFIATAAYGYYSAPEVKALREFRDHYLLTNSVGNAFVRWYYEHGPVAAAYLNAHPGYKPVVRAALLPAVGVALFLTKTSVLTKTVVALFILMIALMTVHRISRKKLSGSGGSL